MNRIESATEILSSATPDPVDPALALRTRTIERIRLRGEETHAARHVCPDALRAGLRLSARDLAARRDGR